MHRYFVKLLSDSGKGSDFFDSDIELDQNGIMKRMVDLFREDGCFFPKKNESISFEVLHSEKVVASGQCGYSDSDYRVMWNKPDNV